MDIKHGHFTLECTAKLNISFVIMSTQHESLCSHAIFNTACWAIKWRTTKKAMDVQ